MDIRKIINLLESVTQDDGYNKSDWEIRNYHKLDAILVKLCDLIVQGQKQDPNTHGMVAAAILDPANNLVSSAGRKINGKWHHAERCAMTKYKKLHGDIPNGSICITTCSPCSERMSDRYEESCTDLINHSNIHKVYAGYNDPTQLEEQRTFNIIETSNTAIRDFCHKLAETFMNWEATQADAQLNENFADGKGPGKPGDSQRHGIPKNATMAQLEKAATASGRKGQLARWQLNMRRSKHHESIEETYDGDTFFETYGWIKFPEDDMLTEAEYHGRKVPLGKPMRGDVKKFKVYVRDPKTGNTKKVNFGDPNMKIKKYIPARRKSFRARHHCDTPGPRTKARYWSCRKW